ncbi:MAG TPA: N-acetylmuramoyl-L-alanine amidase [Flavobacteriales bacterium]|nr:N-acetylmuramoyl-L-alanine amidase [Flavobacteriales bacterium]
MLRDYVKTIKNVMVTKRILYLFVIIFFLCFSGTDPSRESQFRLKTVVIDPGHGGKDPGNLGTGKFKTYEKDVVLAISLKLGKYISENYDDINVIYTRQKDEFIGLKERADIANKNKADIFICIHANSNKSSAPYGTNTFVMGLNKTQANLELSKRENASILMEDDYVTKYEGYDPNSPEADIIFSLYQNAYLDQSLEFAAMVQKQFKNRAKRKDRGVKQAGFLVLHQTTMPSILVETGFLTNKEEEKFLNSENGQDYLASAIYRAFKDYKTVMEGTLPANFSPNEPMQIVDGIIFRVQIVTSSNAISLDSPKFNGITNVQEYVSGGWFKYTAGEKRDLASAYRLQVEVREKGFSSAFVVAFHNGERINLQDAIKMVK